MEKEIQIQGLTRSAPAVPESVQKDMRTVRIAWATDTPVLRSGAWDEYRFGQYWEVLSMDPAHVRMERFNKGLSLLDSHDWSSTDSIIGIAENPEFGGHESTCTLRFSLHNPKAEQVFRDVLDGIIRHYSFGYTVHKYQETGVDENGVPVLLAVDWEPTEVSVVPVPADIAAGLRGGIFSGKKNPCTLIIQEREDMEQDTLRTEDSPDMSLARAGDEKPEAQEEEEDTEETEETEKEPEKGGKKELDAAGIANAERARIRDIRQAYKVFRSIVTEEEVEAMIETGMGADAARAAMISKAAEGQPSITPFARAEVTADAKEKKREAMTKALLFRANPSQYKNTGTEFRGMSLVDMARECLESDGIRTRGMTHSEIARSAFRSGGAMAVSDFPNVLYGAINTSLRDMYQLAPKTYEAWTRRVTVPDFRERIPVQLGDVGRLEKIPEGGEYPRTKISDAREAYKVDVYGHIVPITMQAIVNDYLDAFSRIPQSIAAEAAQHTSDIVYGLLLKNAKMQDGEKVFSAKHKNMASAGSALSVQSMNEAFVAIGEQQNLAGRELNLTPSFIIGGHGMRATASQYLGDTAIYPASATDVVPSYMRNLQFIPEGRIKGNGWYVVCAPSMVDTIEYAYLDGEDGLYTENQWEFDSDVYSIKARLVFGAGVIDYRGMFYNAGI